MAETGLNQNMQRDYDPLTGKYIESDPIGLNGGVNTYSYVRSKPTTTTDSTGLLEQCRSGLDVLKGVAVGPLHHEFQCWTNADGTTTCRGYGRDPSSSVIDAILKKVKGKILQDDENKSAAAASCGIDDNNKCMDDCASKEWQKLEKNISFKQPTARRSTRPSCESVLSNAMFRHRPRHLLRSQAIRIFRIKVFKSCITA